MKLSPRTEKLRTRIVVAFALVLVAGQGIGYWLVDTASSRNARAQLEQELVTGERILARLLEHNRNRLAQAAAGLAIDRDLRAALANGDSVTLTTMLHDHGERIEASTMQLVSSDGKVVAQAARRGARRQVAPADEPEADFAFRRLLDAARVRGSASAVVTLGAIPSQLVVVPVRAPRLVAWVAVGFEIDDRLARDLHRLTGLEVSFLRGDGAGRMIAASTLAREPRRALRELALRAPLDPGVALLDMDGNRYGSRIVDLSPGYLPPMLAVLQRPLGDKLATFAPLRGFLIVLALAGVLAAILLGALLARGITRPLAQLREGAQRIRDGDYGAPVPPGRDDELGALAESFNGMREEIAAREKEMLRLAYQDTLTGLPNRARFGQALDGAIRTALGSGTPLAVLLMDLDRFKLVNQALGHEAGDHVLRQVALRLRQLAPPSAILARLGGDEFAVLVRPDDATPGHGGDPERMAQVLLEMMKHPVMVDGQPLDVGISVGIARYPVDGTDAGTLVRHADLAMYGARRTNRGYAFFGPRCNVARQDRLARLGELRRTVPAEAMPVE